MHWTEALRDKDIVFTHLDHDTSQRYVINVTKLHADTRYKALPTVYIPITKEIADKIAEHHGIEPHRVRRLRGANVVEPVTLIVWPENTHTPIDGNHRYLARYMDGHSEIEAKFVPYKLWTQFLVDGMEIFSDDILLKGASGL